MSVYWSETRWASEVISSPGATFVGAGDNKPLTSEFYSLTELFLSSDEGNQSVSAKYQVGRIVKHQGSHNL